MISDELREISEKNKRSRKFCEAVALWLRRKLNGLNDQELRCALHQIDCNWAMMPELKGRLPFQFIVSEAYENMPEMQMRISDLMGWD